MDDAVLTRAARRRAGATRGGGSHDSLPPALRRLAGPPDGPATLSRLERSAGRHSRWRGAALGALVGFGVGAIVGRLSTHCGASDWICLQAVAVLGGGLMGAGGGAAVGAALPPRERLVLVVRLDR
ncbi:MAG: hypothetical protein R2752_18785 [Vicinamibacterales bacterium]